MPEPFICVEKIQGVIVVPHKCHLLPCDKLAVTLVVSIWNPVLSAYICSANMLSTKANKSDNLTIKELVVDKFYD